MDLHDLSPFPLSIEWEGQEIPLKPFDLRSMTWAERFFSLEGKGGFENMNQILNSDPEKKPFQNAVVEVVFYLSGSGFHKHGIFTAKELKDSVRNHENKVVIFNGFIEAIHQTFKISFPDPKQKEPEMTGGAIFEFFKAQEAEEKHEVKINWAEMFMKFHAVGGMTLDQFYSLTFKQIEVISEEIGYIKADVFRDMAITNGIPAKQIKIPRRKEKQLLN